MSRNLSLSFCRQNCFFLIFFDSFNLMTQQLAWTQWQLCGWQFCPETERYIVHLGFISCKLNFRWQRFSQIKNYRLNFFSCKSKRNWQYQGPVLEVMESYSKSCFLRINCSIFHCNRSSKGFDGFKLSFTYRFCLGQNDLSMRGTKHYMSRKSSCTYSS